MLAFKLTLYGELTLCFTAINGYMMGVRLIGVSMHAGFLSEYAKPSNAKDLHSLLVSPILAEQ
jgi:hypothetical protein